MSNNCSDLSIVVLPDGAVSIGDSAFEGSTSLVSIIISEGITSIGYSAFRNCTQLAEVTCHATVPPVLELFDGACQNVHFEKGGVLYVPNGCVEKYRFSHWGFYFDEIVGVG